MVGGREHANQLGSEHLVLRFRVSGYLQDRERLTMGGDGGARVYLHDDLCVELSIVLAHGGGTVQFRDREDSAGKSMGIEIDIKSIISMSEKRLK